MGNTYKEQPSWAKRVTHSPLVCGRVSVIQQRSEHGRLEPFRWCINSANDERLDGAAAAAARLGDGHPLEQQPQLTVQQARVPAPENLGHESPSRGQDMCCDVESR